MIGDINLDVIAFHRSFPSEGCEEIAERAFVRHGGSGANIAHTLSILGVDVIMLGCVGKDPVGEFLVEGLQKAGVDTSLVQRTEEASGIVYVLVTGSGERTMLAYRGANKYLRHEEIPANLLDNITLLHISGYSLLEGEQRRTALKLLEARTNHPFTLDMCMPLARNPSVLDILAGRLECLFINMQELQELSRYNDVKTPSDIVSRLGCTVVLKKGSGGCEIYTTDNKSFKVLSPATEVVDTTGAGDAFAAGYIYELLKGSPPLICGETAVRLGAAAASTVGGRITLR